MGCKRPEARAEGRRKIPGPAKSWVNICARRLPWELALTSLFRSPAFAGTPWIGTPCRSGIHWCDSAPSPFFPLPPTERSRRLPRRHPDGSASLSGTCALARTHSQIRVACECQLRPRPEAAGHFSDTKNDCIPKGQSGPVHQSRERPRPARTVTNRASRDTPTRRPRPTAGRARHAALSAGRH